MINSKKGLTLIEMMVATTIMTVGILAFASIMGGVTKSVFVTKTQTLATNLAQEKIESLKNLSYYRLLVTTSTIQATESGITPYYYDDTYYPPEALTVGQIRYTRRVLVQKMTESGTNISPSNWWDSDPGLKMVTVHVMWQNGETWKEVVINNLRDNPARVNLNCTISGTASSGSNLSDVKVMVIQNPLYRSMTNGSGFYSIRIGAGTYDVQATKSGYFPKTLSATVAAGTTTLNFPLTAMGSGTVSGTAYLDDHLVISEFCFADGGNETEEYIELYNPTGQNITISPLPGVANFRLTYIRNSDLVETEINPDGQTIYLNTVIPSNHYFLFASTPVIHGVTADAYYSEPTLTTNVPANRMISLEQAGLLLTDLTINTKEDGIGWSVGPPPYGPAAAREGVGIMAPGDPPDQPVERMAYSSSTVADLLPAGAHSTKGNAYDSNQNNLDFQLHVAGTQNPQNSGMGELPQTGTPAMGAVITCDDKLSASKLASSGITPGTFTVTNVATGTWNILVSSNGWIYTNDVVTVANLVNTSLSPILLSSPATGGYAAGRVVNSGGIIGINSILVTANGVPDTTDPNGSYRLALDVGTYTVVANPENNSTQYTTDNSTGIVINLGVITDVEDLMLYPGGGFRGFVTTNGTDPLPGIPIIATSTATGQEIGSSISDSQGVFTFADVQSGTYIFSPQLETGESATPSSISKTVVNGTTVFVGTITVSSAFGTLQGTARLTSGEIINTGVLIVAVPQPTPIGATPPTIDATLRNGSVYYYMGSADSLGNYAIRLRGGLTYNIAAWYTAAPNGIPTTPVQRTATSPITGGASSTVNFTW